MHSTVAIGKLCRQRETIKALKKCYDLTDGAEFRKCKRDTEIAIEKIFGCDSNFLKDFSHISYSLNVYSRCMPKTRYYQAYLHGLVNAEIMLAAMISELEAYGVGDQEHVVEQPDALSRIELICQRFHRVVRQFQQRHNDRPTFDIEDEYDVQDMLHALLSLHFEDIRPEEWTPSYAGASSRVDFLLKQEKIVVEVKKTRNGLKAREVCEQLIIDIARYQTHQDCKLLLCFVYDPDGKIANPVGLEKDLESIASRIRVRVIVTPKN